MHIYNLTDTQVDRLTRTHTHTHCYACVDTSEVTGLREIIYKSN